MKRLIYLTFAAFLTVPAFSQNAFVADKDTLTQNLELDNLRKIAFKDGSVVTTYSDGSTKSQKLSETNKLQFTSTDRLDDGISQDGSTYTIYDLSGRPVKTHTDKSCDQPFDLNDLISGIYLLKTGNRTIKIVK